MDVFMFLILSFMPSVEPRYAAAAAVLSGWNILATLLLASVLVVVLASALVLLLSLADRVLLGLPVLGRLWMRYRNHVRERVGRYVERWGILGLTAFVAVPLPGTGVYTGALAAYLLGMRPWSAWWALVAGGVLSTIITLLLSLSGHVLLPTL